MNNRLIKEMKIPVSLCDNTGHLDVPGFFTIFMDMASEHAADIGMGMDAMADKGLIWLAVKTKLKIYSRPALFSKVTATTWPAAPGRIRCDRLYTMKDGETLLAEAKNEWTMYRPATGKLRKMENGYPKELVVWPEIVCDEPYAKLKGDFADAQEICRHKVTRGDLDTSQHMNNVEYINVIFNAFSSQQLSQMAISQVEIAYKNQCFEGEVLSVRIKETENGFEMGIIKEDGTAGAIALITLNQ